MKDDLKHYGILGMKWGVRRYRNKDGSLTTAGKRRYSDKEISDYRKRKISEAPTKAQSPRGANKGWYKNAPKATLAREMRREEVKRRKLDEETRKLVEDSKSVRVKAEPGMTRSVVGGYTRKEGNRIYASHHVVDEYGNVKLSYINGVEGHHYVSAGKDAVNKMDLTQHFNSLDGIWDYDVYE